MDDGSDSLERLMEERLRITAESSAAISAAWAAVREMRMQSMAIQIELRTARDRIAETKNLLHQER
jgi:hypothetical protein